MVKNKYRMIGTLIIIFVISILFMNLNKSLKIEEDSIHTRNNVSVKRFNAISNDKIDDTSSIQKAINYIADRGGGTVSFPKGIYLIDSVKSLRMKDNIVLKFEKGTILRALPNDKGSYEIVRIHGVKNVSLIGNVVIEGDRDDHTGEEGEWGFGVSIRGSEKINIENVTIKNCWGDGIYIGSTDEKEFNKDITIKNPVLENNRRQGISVISAINLKILHPIITGTNGTAPESGIDLEPNEPTERLENVKIINPYTENNKGYGILINLKYLKGSKHSVNITVDNTKKIKDKIHIVKPNYVKGTVKIIKIY
ncbi:right-handed parallel beta-helix repeat-containing protein [Priestia filamentosa]|uniref:right-handed parallel beta-helix repeat-containing protein n=1 Tax=Priestia filamentosa TaxID=1402861 RepID=UPI00289544D1|nr:right-handed parallel beta-helix repeat-containing protein [Priestia filamentosa]MDT3766200.1 right-handed parallel beta-helix repeat-containing protein [Priestia filamentosa]